MSNHDFITFKVKMGIKRLGNEVYLKKKHDIFIFWNRWHTP